MTRDEHEAQLRHIPAPRQLWTAKQVADALFHGQVTARWVRKHCPGVRLSRVIVLYDPAVVQAWIDARAEAA